MAKKNFLSPLSKSRSGIRGFDEITDGGFPQGRTSLVCGNAGCGKTIMGMEFLAHGALEFKEAGVFVSFEETPEELEKNFASLGYDLKKLEAEKKLLVEYVYIERSEIEETGSYDLEGLFIRLGFAIDQIGAKRVVLDTLEVLFAGLSQEGIIRAELRRLFRWLKEKGVTSVVTAERGEGFLTRYGLEEYVADCVILLDLRVTEQIATRRLRIVKYRGSPHGADEYPFLIDEKGFSIMPLSTVLLNNSASKEFVSTGLKQLDGMLNGKGVYRATTILISGAAGSGKSTLAAGFVEASAKRRERALYFAFEESPAQIQRNMGSIGFNLAALEKRNLLKFHASRPTAHGLEMHLVTMHKMVQDYAPKLVIVDPISNLIEAGSKIETKSMLVRLIDFLKMEGITTVFTDLVHGDNIGAATTSNSISSLIDTWISLENIESVGERNRGIQILKSRGMPHSNQVREFVISSSGIKLVDIYFGSQGIMTGTARQRQQVSDGKR